VLYSGWFPGEEQNDQDTNPYAKAIDAVGICALQALPGQKNERLDAFLANHACA